MRHRYIFLFVAFVFGLLPVTASAIEFAPHRALYNLVLDKARTGSGITGVTGKMAVEWQDSCSGWTFEYHSVIDVEFSETKSIRLTSTATSWESGDGRSYRFSVSHKTDGTEVERIEGVARADASGAGYVEFTKPKARRQSLPKGTLFPIAHSLSLMETADRKKPPVFLSQTVFDGMDVKGLYQVNAAIGRLRPSRNSSKNSVSSLKNLRSWHVNLAYFAAESRKPEPEHEIKMRLYANGIADDMLMDFDEFTIRGRIHKIDLTPKRTCR